MGRGAAHWPVLASLGTVGVIAAIIVQTVTAASFSVVDLLAGIILLLVMFLLKKVSDLEKNVAAGLATVKERVETNADEIDRLRTAKHDHANILNELRLDVDLLKADRP